MFANNRWGSGSERFAKARWMCQARVDRESSLFALLPSPYVSGLPSWNLVPFVVHI